MSGMGVWRGQDGMMDFMLEELKTGSDSCR